ncbi:hypothetical protein ACWEOE_38960 [Amycolatopsis sp. NPDC004368]
MATGVGEPVGREGVEAGDEVLPAEHPGVVLVGLPLAGAAGDRLRLGLLFVPLFDFVLGDATTEEVGPGAGVLNAAQQFANALGVAALGTVFSARVGPPTWPVPSWCSASVPASTW